MEIIILLIFIIICALIWPLLSAKAPLRPKVGGGTSAQKKEKVKRVRRARPAASIAEISNGIIGGEEDEEDLITYTPYYDITLTREILKRAPALGEIIKESPICPHVSMIPHRMMPERIKKMVHCGHSSPSLHDFSIAAMFLADFKEHVAVIFGAPKCPIDVFGQISQIPYIFIGSDVKVSSPATKHYTELTEEVIAGIDNNSAQYYIIERISRLDLLAQLKAPRIILSFDRQPVEALLLAAPTAWCYPTKMAVGTIRAKAILTPPFGERGKLRPFVYAATGERRRFDAGEIQEKLFYYDVCMRGYGNHRVKYNVSRLDHCGDCAIFTYACDYAGIKVSEKFINSLDPFFGAKQPSHIPQKFNSVEEVFANLTNYIHAYIQSKVSLDSLRQINITLPRAWWYYSSQKLLADIYGDRAAARIIRGVIFGTQVGFSVVSMDNLYYVLKAFGIENDTGSIIKNSFNMVEAPINQTESGDKMTINGETFTKPACYADISLSDYITGYLTYDHTRPAIYNDPKFIRVIEKCMEKYKLTSLHAITFSPTVRVAKDAKYYFLSKGDEIPVKYPAGSLVVFISHEINTAIKLLYDKIFYVNKVPCITAFYSFDPQKPQTNWGAEKIADSHINTKLTCLNTSGIAGEHPITLMLANIDATFVSTILSS